MTTAYFRVFQPLAQTYRVTGLTDKWFYKLIQDGEFPKPIKLGRSSRWLKSEIEQWLQARIAESRRANSTLKS
ncbi:TPA: helix-turn-helix transcriptional regulator [Providencia rettgeri]